LSAFGVANVTRLPVALFSAACLVLTAGCFHTPPHSAYRPIHRYAIDGDAVGVAAELAKNPGDLNLPEDAGLTPLHLAAGHCRTNVVALLLDKGAKLNVKAQGGATPLHLAAQEGCADAVTMLLDKGANVNARDDQGRTPLKRAEEWHQEAVAQLLRGHGGTDQP
jgi:ankyrin repeat protein